MSLVRLGKLPREWNSLDWMGLLAWPALLLARFFPFSQFKLSLCNFKAMTGLPCPTCNMTTCFALAMHGRLAEAVAVSPLGFLVFLASLAAALQFIWARLLRGPGVVFSANRRQRAVFWIAVAGLFALNWAYLLLTRAGPAGSGH